MLGLDAAEVTNMWRIVEARKIKKLTADIIVAEEYQNWLSCHAMSRHLLSVSKWRYLI